MVFLYLVNKYPFIVELDFDIKQRRRHMILTDNEPKSLEMGYYPASDTYVLMRFECHEKSLEGEFRNLYVEESEKFNSISEFIYKLELMLEQINVPKATNCCRKGWGDPIKFKCGDDSAVPPKPMKFLENPSMAEIGKSGQFFLIHIRYRCNSSWQGEIRWLRKNCTMMFRSVLELVMVLQSTVNQQYTSEL